MTQLRNRPFMVVSYTYVLADGQKSHTKGFMETAEWNPVENMKIVDRVSNKDMQAADIILDIFEGTLVKCRDSTMDKSKLYTIFIQRHKGEILESLKTWIQRDPANKERVDAFVARFASTKEETNETENSTED